MKKILFVLSAGFFYPMIIFGQTTWTANSSEILFKIKNAGITVTGRFGGFNSSLVFSPDKLESSSLKGSVEVATIKTGINKRDQDLKGENYFNEVKYKLIEVKSSKLYKKGTQYAGLFNVTIKGITKQVEIPFEFTQNGNEAKFNGNFTIDRGNFGVGGETLTMADNADVSIEIKAKKAGSK